MDGRTKLEGVVVDVNHRALCHSDMTKDDFTLNVGGQAEQVGIVERRPDILVERGLDAGKVGVQTRERVGVETDPDSIDAVL